MKYGIAEIMKMAVEQPNHRTKLEFLRKNDSWALRRAFKLVYEPGAEWDFPEKWKPEYTPSPYFDQEPALYQSIKKMDKFFVGGYAGLSRERKQLLFVQLLESVTPDDALLLIGMKDGKMPWAGLGPKTVREAFPGLIGIETGQEK